MNDYKYVYHRNSILVGVTMYSTVVQIILQIDIFIEFFTFATSSPPALCSFEISRYKSYGSVERCLST